MERGKAIVFGGTGFLGRRVVQCLLERDFSVRVASRHRNALESFFPALGSALSRFMPTSMMIAPLLTP